MLKTFARLDRNEDQVNSVKWRRLFEADRKGVDMKHDMQLHALEKNRATLRDSSGTEKANLIKCYDRGKQTLKRAIEMLRRNFAGQ